MKIFFPYTMLSTAFFHSITTPFILLAVLQVPIYGLIVAFASKGKRLSCLATALAVMHILAAGLCFILMSDNFS